jgi:integrase
VASVNVRNKYLYFDFKFRGLRFRESTLLTDTPGNRRKMNHLANKIQAEITLDTFDYEKYFPNSKNLSKIPKQQIAPDKVKHSFPLFTKFAETWFEEMKLHWRKSTYDTHLSAYNARIKPFFDSKFIHEVTKKNLLDFRQHLVGITSHSGKPLSSSRINHIMNPLRMILSEASEQLEIPNPFKNIKALQVPKSQIEAFSPEEINKIIDNIREDYQAYIITKFYTGLRSGEIHGLYWEHIDFDNNIIQVRQSYVRGQIIDTKTAESVRDIQMISIVKDTLIKHQKLTKGNLVFTNSNGGPIDNKGFSKHIWHPLLNRLGIKKRTAYQTRHTAATLMLASGESPEWIARQLGHSNTEMLFKVYSRYVKNIKHNDGEHFSSLVLENA